MAERLTKAQFEELRRICVARMLPGTDHGHWQLPLHPLVAAALARKGLLEVREQSEHVRGERRAHWKEYAHNAAGRQALKESPDA